MKKDLKSIKYGRVMREPKYCLDNSVVGDSWRMFRIMSEFVEGFDAMSAVDVPAVTIYGSARTPVDHKYYLLAEVMEEGSDEQKRQAEELLHNNG